MKGKRGPTEHQTQNSEQEETGKHVGSHGDSADPHPPSPDRFRKPWDRSLPLPPRHTLHSPQRAHLPLPPSATVPLSPLQREKVAPLPCVKPCRAPSSLWWVFPVRPRVLGSPGGYGRYRDGVRGFGAWAGVRCLLNVPPLQPELVYFALFTYCVSFKRELVG